MIDLFSFLSGGFAYLKKVCGWAKAAGISVILDLHGSVLTKLESLYGDRC